ncbi:MAG: prohibitin family protein [Clostridia bacterium]|nr:prohibitin family protein [Clostridia bacterium]
MIGTLLGVVFVVIAGIALLMALWKSGNLSLKGKKAVSRKSKFLATVFAGVAVVFGCLFVFIPPSIQTVETGQVAVVKHLGEAKEIRTSGTYFDFWITNTYSYYDATVQTIDIQAAAYSKDAQTMDISMTVQYRINAEQAIDIATKYGDLQTLSSRIESVSIERAKSHLSSFSAMEIIETRSSISPAVEQSIRETISDQYYVTIVAGVVTNIDFSDAFESTVENKMIAEQEVLTAEYEKEKAIIAAEQQLEVAKREAEAVVEAAKADAKAQELVAQAQAQAIAYKSVEVARMLGFTILENTTDEVTVYTIDFTGKTAEEIALISEYLKYVEYLETWDGKLPTTLVTDSSSASIILPMP